MAWALRNPNAGIVETEEMDHAFCLDVMRSYLGRVEAQQHIALPDRLALGVIHRQHLAVDA